MIRFVQILIVKVAERFGNALVGSSTFHRIVHTTNHKTASWYQKFINPDGARKEELKDFFANQSKRWTEKEKTTQTPPKQTPPKEENKTYSGPPPGIRAPWYTQYYQTFRYHYLSWKNKK
eukprot:TRINITY_DN370_c0_g1_i1.p1 TRINITY_DN370_c0_g1~~TRINITY_DN370_c0_g1_i1.p1  ORF type:complete len:133 (-),score=34.99 TRINITY_DN370_c0_g1_i1:179-538(-)